ncbi:MAG: protein kinase [Polyangiaceae bacterium]
MVQSGSTRTSSPNALPRKFGRYTLFDFVGKGGMAEIYLGRSQTELGATRLSVVKLILSEYATFPKFADMLIFEAKLAAQLSHANVVQVYDLGREQDRLFISMEYVEGFDLNALLRRCSKQKIPLPTDFALFIITSALRGLDYAHRRTDEAGKPLGIVHRDVSPSNLLISFEGEVKLCDFGIAHANDAVQSPQSTDTNGAAPYRNPDESMSEALQGKAGYMSPEHARGEAIDARADVFAAGIVLWELLAGRRLYRVSDTSTGDSLVDLARKAEIPELPTRDLPHEEALHAIVKKALAKDRNDRYPSAAAMLRDLESFAMDARMAASPLRIGEWMEKSFSADLIDKRRARERGAAAVAKGPLVVLTPLPAATPLMPPVEEASSTALSSDLTSSELVADPPPDSLPAPTNEPEVPTHSSPPSFFDRLPWWSVLALVAFFIFAITVPVVLMTVFHG